MWAPPTSRKHTLTEVSVPHDFGQSFIITWSPYCTTWRRLASHIREVTADPSHGTETLPFLITRFWTEWLPVTDPDHQRLTQSKQQLACPHHGSPYNGSGATMIMELKTPPRRCQKSIRLPRNASVSPLPASRTLSSCFHPVYPLSPAVVGGSITHNPDCRGLFKTHAASPEKRRSDKWDWNLRTRQWLLTVSFLQKINESKTTTTNY